MKSNVVAFPNAAPRLVEREAPPVAPPVAPPAPEVPVEAFEVVVPWVRLSLPVKNEIYQVLAARERLLNPCNLGHEIQTYAAAYAWAGDEGRRDRQFELMLLKADFEIAPAPKSRTREKLELEMPLAKWERIRLLADFYGTSATSICQALLLPLRARIHQFQKAQEAGRVPPR
jgi:hypothetical protein